MDQAIIRNGQYNIGQICTRLQCERGFAQKTAMRWIGAHDERAKYTFGDLERQLQRHAHSFAGSLDWDLGAGKLVLTDCWVNIMPRHTAHSLHLHPNSVISGTYYVTTPRGCAGLKFEDPRLSNFMAAPPRKANARSENQWYTTYPAEAGTVILFESWLRHEVAANPVDAERISISFNYAWI